MQSSQRVVRGVAATLAVTITDGSGEPVAASGTVTASAVRSDGVTVLSAATAAASTAGWDAPNPYTVTLPAASNSMLDVLSVTWTDSGNGSQRVTSVEVAGGVFVSSRDIRRSDSTLLDAAKYPADEILRVRDEVEVEFETVCRRAFVPRFASQVLRGSGSPELVLPFPHLRRVRSVTYTDGSAVANLDVSKIRADTVGVARLAVNGAVPRLGGALTDVWPDADLVVSWEHGLDAVPDDVRRAALIRVRSRLNQSKSGVPDRAVSFTVAEGGTFAIATPGQRGVITGIPEVDVVLQRWAFRRHKAGMI